VYDLLCMLIRSFWKICFVFSVLIVVCTFCAHNTLYTCVNYLVPTCCFDCVFRGFFSSSHPQEFYHSAARPTAQTTDGGFQSATPRFCDQVTSSLGAVTTWAQLYKENRQHIKQFNIHTQPLLLVRMAFFLPSSVFRTPATPTHRVHRKSWAVISF